MKILAACLSFLITTIALAGSIDHSNAPAPTMLTLQELSDRLAELEALAGSGGGSGGGAVPKTGVTLSRFGNDDGHYEAGVAWPSPRFLVGTDVASNCVVDLLTGLMWLRNPDPERRRWSNAVVYCESLNGSDGRGGYTDWRMPNIRELNSLVDFGRTNPALPADHPFLNIQLTGLRNTNYWSSSARIEGGRWAVSFPRGFMVEIDLFNNTTSTNLVWPVRGGQLP